MPAPGRLDSLPPDQGCFSDLQANVSRPLHVLAVPVGLCWPGLLPRSAVRPLGRCHSRVVDDHRGGAPTLNPVPALLLMSIHPLAPALCRHPHPSTPAGPPWVAVQQQQQEVPSCRHGPTVGAQAEGGRPTGASPAAPGGGAAPRRPASAQVGAVAGAVAHADDDTQDAARPTGSQEALPVAMCASMALRARLH